MTHYIFIMKMKHILLIGAIALVVVGCVLAAGCTSTTNNGVNPASGVAITMLEDQDDTKYPQGAAPSQEEDSSGSVADFSGGQRQRMTTGAMFELTEEDDKLVASIEYRRSDMKAYSVPDGIRPEDVYD